MFLKSTNSANQAASKTAQKAQAPARKAVPSVVSADMHVLGNIVSDGIIDFDGTIDGNIKCASLVLRHNGRVNGEVHAESVQIYGRVKGLIKAKSVHLYATSSVEGVIMHEVISIEDGAVIDGKFKRTNKTSSGSDSGSYNSAPAPVTDDEYLLEPITMDESAPKALENLRLIAG